MYDLNTSFAHHISDISLAPLRVHYYSEAHVCMCVCMYTCMLAVARVFDQRKTILVLIWSCPVSSTIFIFNIQLAC